MDNPIAVLVLFPLVLLLLAFIIIPPIFLWRLRYSSLKKAREMATGFEDGVIALAALLAGNLLLGVILRPLILQSHSADALTFGLLFADFLGGYYVVIRFARIWLAKKRIRAIEAQSEQRSSEEV
jgi:hypothetical protein